MTQFDFLGVQLDFCPETGGIWFDQGELGRIRAASAEHFAHLDALVVPEVGDTKLHGRMQKLCPNCALPLEPFTYQLCSPVTLDTCDSCGGVFAEDGELTAIYEYLAQIARGRGVPATPTNEAVERAAFAFAEMSGDQARAEQKATALGGIFRILMAPVRRRIL